MPAATGDSRSVTIAFVTNRPTSTVNFLRDAIAEAPFDLGVFVHTVVEDDHRETGFEPAVVIETSPNNFQVWLNHGRVLSDRFLSTLVARQLASRFGGDRGSCDWRHFGRLAGFTNQKKERRLENGFQPFVRLRSSEGKVYSAAKEFLREVGAQKRERFSRREPPEMARPQDNDAPVRPITSFYTDSRYGGDLHRADMAWALNAAAHSLSREQIEDEILKGRDLSKKGSASRRLAYAMRTASKAITLSAQ